MGEARSVLVIGGTGMLRPAVRRLLKRGVTVLAVARRPDRAAPPMPTPGEFIPIRGEWSDPGALVESVCAAASRRGISVPLSHGAVIWVHSPFRSAVMDELDRVLAADATVLQLWGSAARDPREVMAEEARSERRWRERHVFLGYHREAGASRWLTDEEISHATIHAWDTDGDCFYAGRLDPWN